MLHHTGSTAPDLNQAKYLALHSAPVSCHYVVGKDGHIWHIADDKKCTRHAGTGSYNGITNRMNLHAIGIEVCSNGSEFADVQRQVVRELVVFLMEKYAISADHVIRHKDYTSRKRDIGDDFWNGEVRSFKDYQASLTQVIDTRDPLILEAIKKGYYNGVAGDGVTNRTVLLAMKMVRGEYQSKIKK